MNKCINYFCLILIISVTLQPLKLFPQSSGYAVIGKIDIGGEGRWDYLLVDTTAHRLFVSHSTKVHIIDLKTKSIIGDINNLNGVHGIAIAPEYEKGFISNGRNNSVTVFDLKTFKTISQIEIPYKNPDAIIYEPYSKRIFTFNGGSSNATAINPLNGEIDGTINLDGKPEFSVSDNKGKMFVNIEDKNEIEVFNPKSLKVISKWSIEPVAEPSGLAIDLETKRLFSVGRNKLMAVVDAESGKLITTLPIGSGVDGCAFDPVMHLAFSSNGEGTITIIKEESPDQFKVAENIITQKGARTITINPSTHLVYTIGMLDKKEKESGETNNKNDLKSFGVLILGHK
jgi:DNA-binding beta-propeller fold protein YncE